MNKIIYRGIVNYQRDIFPAQIKIAKDYLRTVYDCPDFEDLEFILSSNCRGSNYYRNDNSVGKYITPTIRIADDFTLRLYKMKSLKLKRYKLMVGNYLNIICALVHELTHHIQHNEDRRKGELETTRNEVEFLREHYPDIYNKLRNG